MVFAARVVAGIAHAFPQAAAVLLLFCSAGGLRAALLQPLTSPLVLLPRVLLQRAQFTLPQSRSLYGNGASGASGSRVYHGVRSRREFVAVVRLTTAVGPPVDAFRHGSILHDDNSCRCQDTGKCVFPHLEPRVSMAGAG
jgi:hypothetical protein